MQLDRRVWEGGIAAAVILIGGLVTIAVVAVPDRRDDIWIEVAKAGIQLLVVIGLGAVVSTVMKSAEAARDRGRQRDERRFAIFAQIVAAYHRLKFVRRNLRMVGIRSRPEQLRPEQVEALRSGMETIAEVQLEFEEVMRSLDARSAFDDAEEIARHLGLLADYVGNLVKEWEDHGECFWSDNQSRRVGELPRLQAFIGRAADDFRPNAATPMGWLEWIVRGELPEGRAAQRSTAHTARAVRRLVHEGALWGASRRLLADDNRALVRARSEPATGDLAKAKTNLTSAARLRPQLDYALPWPPRSTRPRAAQG